MTQSEKKVVDLKRMKNLFLVFLKQFEVDEYKLLMQFLQLIISKYNSKPSNLFGEYFYAHLERFNVQVHALFALV